MAIRALEDGVITRIRVARRADPVRVPVVHREPCVVESCAKPTGRSVAGRAGSRETC